MSGGFPGDLEPARPLVVRRSRTGWPPTLRQRRPAAPVRASPSCRSWHAPDRCRPRRMPTGRPVLAVRAGEAPRAARRRHRPGRRACRANLEGRAEYEAGRYSPGRSTRQGIHVGPGGLKLRPRDMAALRQPVPARWHRGRRAGGLGGLDPRRDEHRTCPPGAPATVTATSGGSGRPTAHPRTGRMASVASWSRSCRTGTSSSPCPHEVDDDVGVSPRCAVLPRGQRHRAGVDP